MHAGCVSCCFTLVTEFIEVLHFAGLHNGHRISARFNMAWVCLTRKQSLFNDHLAFISAINNRIIRSMKYAASIVLGKFMPLHEGHIHLIDSAVKQSKHVTVLVCSLTRQPIPGQLRFEWMKKTYPNPNTSIIHIKDDNIPQQPQEHPLFWDIWTSLIKNNCPKNLDCIFSSEPYGRTLGDWMKINHVDVDIKRKFVPISATKIREKPITNWEFISKAAQPYFVKRVALMGPQSSGKTTLAQKLARRFNTAWVHEYGRQLSERKPDLELLDFKDIVHKQIQIENQQANNANKILICDTECITTMIFSHMYFPKEAHTLTKFFEDAIKKYSPHYELYLIAKPFGDGHQDGTRRYLEKRQQHFQNIVKELKQRRRPYQVLEGTYEQIFEKACRAIQTKILTKY